MAERMRKVLGEDFNAWVLDQYEKARRGEQSQADADMAVIAERRRRMEEAAQRTITPRLDFPPTCGILPAAVWQFWPFVRRRHRASPQWRKQDYYA